MIRFIHTADIHFGMENYGKIDQKQVFIRVFLDFERALNFCIDKAIEQNVDFFSFLAMPIKPHIQHRRNSVCLCSVSCACIKRTFQ